MNTNLTRSECIALANKLEQAVVQPNKWGRVDVAFPRTSETHTYNNLPSAYSELLSLGWGWVLVQGGEVVGLEVVA